MNLPRPEDLISVMESEPSVLDAGVPWAYNTLTFTGHIPAGTYELRIVPGYGSVHFRVSGSDVALDLSWEAVLGLDALPPNRLLLVRVGGETVDITLRPQLSVRVRR